MDSRNSLTNVVVVGAGTMGRGIAQVFLENDFEVTLVDPIESARKQAHDYIQGGLSKRDLEDRIDALTLLEEIPQSSKFELGIEAVPEKLSLKRDVLNNLSQVVTEILATNTSSIPLKDLVESVQQPAHFLGVHFMNPAPVMPLVELIEGSKTDSQVMDRAETLIGNLGKNPVRVQDSPGFVSNRLVMALINLAIRLVDQGVAKPKAIDTIMKQGMGHEMGPIEVADFIGLDVCLETLKIIDQRVEENVYQPARLLQDKVEEGQLGQKTDRGFYGYD